MVIPKTTSKMCNEISNFEEKKTQFDAGHSVHFEIMC